MVVTKVLVVMMAGTIGIKSNNDVYFYGIGLSILVLGGFSVYYNFNKIKPQKKSVEVNTKVEEPLVYRRML